MSRPTNTPEVPCLVPGCILTGTHDEHESAPGHKITHVWAVISEHPYRERAVSPADYLREIAALPDGQDPATLRARLQERYERPERPCAYDPADEEPEAEPVAYRVTDVTPWPEVFPPWVRCNDGRFLNTVTGEYRDPLSPGESMPLEEWRKAQRFEAQYPTDDWTPPRPEPVEYPEVSESTWGPINLTWPDPMVTRYPSDMFAPPRDASARADEILRHPLTGTSTWGTLTLPPGGDAFEPKPSFGRVNWTNHVVEDPSNGPRLDDSIVRFMERVRSAAVLRSYLRTLTNPDATPKDVNAALDALTPEDRALVSEAIPSWGSARMTRVKAIAPFMDRFETMVRERDPRAQEEGALILSALRENDPTRSTVEALMEIAKTPKVNP